MMLLSLGLFAFFDSKDVREWTTAVCEGNVCRDYLVKCSGDNVVEMNPVTGFVTFPENWKDTRLNKDLC